MGDGRFRSEEHNRVALRGGGLSDRELRLKFAKYAIALVFWGQTRTPLRLNELHHEVALEIGDSVAAAKLFPQVRAEVSALVSTRDAEQCVALL